MNIVFHVSPLSKVYRDKISKKFEIISAYYSLQDLRRLGPVKMFFNLLRLRANKIILPVEDETSRTVLPVLYALALIVRSKSIIKIDSNIKINKVYRIQCIYAILSLFYSSLKAQVIKRKNVRNIKYFNELSIDKVRFRDVNNILYLNSNLWYGLRVGGSVGHISGVVNAFLNRGFSVDFASLGDRLMVNEDARFIKLRPPSTYAFPGEVNNPVFANSVTRQLIYKYKNQNKPDFIYQRLSVANISGVQLSKRWKIPFILEYNGSEAWVSANWGHRRMRYYDDVVDAENACLRHANLVVTISDPLKDELIERGVNPNQIVNYPNCIDPKIFSPERFDDNDRYHLRDRWRISSDAKVITFLGTFGKWHGANVYANAIKLLASKRRDWLIKNKIMFFFVGDGSQLHDVKNILADISDVDKFCRFTGLVNQEDAPLYLEASDILISPHVPNDDGSKFFGSPTKLFEYLAMGKPIIASNLDQLGDILQPSISLDDLDNILDDSVSVLVKPGCIEELMKAIVWTVDNPEISTRIGRNARKLALHKYTWDIHVNKILSVLNSEYK
tara:strand:- start:463 stop:2139 length:1677 start_codon:yes stop_codon:yes gene_type:complete